MVPSYIRMIITAILSVTAVIFRLVYKNEPRKDVMLAMLLSSFGDIFMVNAEKIGQYSTYVGAAAFIAAHILYGECFRKQIKKTDGKYKNSAFYVGLAVMVVSACVLGVLAFTAAEEKKPVMFVLILIYIAAIGYNLCSNFSYSKIAGGVSYILPIAITAFYLTDIFIFEDMLNIDHSMRQYVWLIYPEAQLALIIFNSPLKINSQKEGVIQ